MGQSYVILQASIAMLPFDRGQHLHICRQLMGEFEIAMLSECSIDEHYYRAYGLDSTAYDGVPRPAKWVGFTKRHPIIASFAIRFLKLSWVLGGGVFYYLLQMTLYVYRFVFTPNKIHEIQLDDEFCLAFSKRAVDVIGDYSIGRKPKCWIVFPWNPIPSLNKGQRVVEIVSFIRFTDFITAFLLSITALYSVGLRRTGSGVGGRVLQTYIAFQWFLARIALNKLNAGVFITAEHHDRWAVLADCLVGSKSGAGASLVIVQHGVESSLKAAHPLKNVARLYVYDEASLRTFEENIIDKCNIKRPLDVCFFTPQISLKRLDKSDFPYEKTILVVGHPSVESLHIHIYEKFLNGVKVNVIYKAHPTVRASKNIMKVGWVIWKENDEFPLVDLLVSYPSTLVEEYRAVGVEAVVHPYAITVDDARDYLNYLDAVLNEFAAN